MTAVGTMMTAEGFDALSEEEGRKWELLDGQLIEASSAAVGHNRILVRLAMLLNAFAEAQRLGTVIAETDLAVRKTAACVRIFVFLRKALGVTWASTGSR